MHRRLVVKRLRASDLSFFNAYLRRHLQAKQKGFNLDQAVVEKQFFPSLAEIADSLPRNQIPVQLVLHGPGGAQAHVLMRKILKQEKNWRLNGEVIHDPDDQPGRYALLAPDDFALMDFVGTAGPDSVKAVLVSAASPADAALHRSIAAHFPTGSMWVPTVVEVEQIVRAANVVSDHPVRDWLDDELIEDIGLGGGESTRTLVKRRRGRGMSRDELHDARAAANVIGRRGEDLLDRHLKLTPWPGVVRHQWVADNNAVSPFDFEIEMITGERRVLEAKSTSGRFENPLHMSLGEIDEAANGVLPYDIVRLYEVGEGEAKFRIAYNVGGKLAPVLAALAALPAGITLDSLSFLPDYFDFDAQVHRVEVNDEVP